MPSAVRHVTIDCADPYTLARFWAAAVGGRLHDDDDQPGDPEALVIGVEPVLLFERVPDVKTVKNRVHLDLQPQDITRDAEVERLLGLGASFVADHRKDDATGWAVLADPEGNEFCVERSKAERGDS